MRSDLYREGPGPIPRASGQLTMSWELHRGTGAKGQNPVIYRELLLAKLLSFSPVEPPSMRSSSFDALLSPYARRALSKRRGPFPVPRGGAENRPS